MQPSSPQPYSSLGDGTGICRVTTDGGAKSGVDESNGYQEHGLGGSFTMFSHSVSHQGMHRGLFLK